MTVKGKEATAGLDLSIGRLDTQSPPQIGDVLPISFKVRASAFLEYEIIIYRHFDHSTFEGHSIR